MRLMIRFSRLQGRTKYESGCGDGVVVFYVLGVFERIQASCESDWISEEAKMAQNIL